MAGPPMLHECLRSDGSMDAANENHARFTIRTASLAALSRN